jgi:hypothetical protein|tara:strand:- start:178 stop:351 length:174 start_codon:yes stop_codon:yes gene_type:complete
MSIEKMMLMKDLKPYDKWLLENRYDGPIPIEVIKDKIASYDEVVDGEDLEIWERWNK